MILENRRITIRDVADEVGESVDEFEAIFFGCKLLLIKGSTVNKEYHPQLMRQLPEALRRK